MEKDEFKKKVLETKIFQELKDDIKINTMSQVRYYLIEHNYYGKVDARNIYVKLTNYRIKHYGSSIMNVCVDKDERGKYILNDYL